MHKVRESFMFRKHNFRPLGNHYCFWSHDVALYDDFRVLNVTDEVVSAGSILAEVHGFIVLERQDHYCS